MENEFWSLEKFCEETGYAKNTVYKNWPEYVKSGLPVYKFGSRFLRFKKVEVIEWINKRTQPTASTAMTKPAEMLENAGVSG